MTEKPPLNPSATLPASTDDDSFGSRKARSSFGKGFFKIRGGKKTSSSPSLGTSPTRHVDVLLKANDEILTTERDVSFHQFILV